MKKEINHLRSELE